MARPTAPVWRIAVRAAQPPALPVYDVYRGRRRVVWGLPDRATAERWVRRLGGAPPEPDSAMPAAQARGAAVRRRAWWGEHD